MLALVTLAFVPALSGCLSRTHLVRKTRTTPIVLSTTLDQLITQVNARFDTIKTFNATVEIAASTGGGSTGVVTEHTGFSGYIIMRKPEDLRVILLLPVLRTRAIDMVSDGKTFKLLIPPRNRAVVGSNEVTETSKNGLENLRPSVFFDSLFIRGLSSGQIVSLTSDERLLNPDSKKDDLVIEPDYDLAVLGQPEGQTAPTIRVVHIGRSNLLPYQQDIYDKAGHIVTRAMYSNYQVFSGLQFPTKIVINRPADQYSLTLTITKLTLNDKLEDDQFELKIPENVPVQQMK